MKMIKILAAIPALLTLVFLCFSASATAATAQTTPVPLKIEVTQGGEKRLGLDAVILDHVNIGVLQPSTSTSEEVKNWPVRTDLVTALTLEISVVDTSRSTVSLSVNFKDSSSGHVYARMRPEESTEGMYGSNGVFVLEKGKPFKLDYQTCRGADKPWCNGVLNITAN